MKGWSVGEGRRFYRGGCDDIVIPFHHFYHTPTHRTLALVRQATIKVALEQKKTVARQKTGTYGSMETSKPLAEAEEGKVPLMAEEKDVVPKLTLQKTKTVSKLYSDGLTSEFAAELLKKFGRNELPEKKKPKWLIVRLAFVGVWSALAWI